MKGKNARKSRRASLAQASAGRANLARYMARGGKPNLRHGIHVWLRFGVLPAGREDLAGLLDAYTGQAVADLGGAESITAGQAGLLAAQRTCLGVILLAAEHLQQNGFLAPNGKPQAALATLASYLNSFRLNQLSLGLERRQKPVDALEVIAREYASKSPESAAEVQQ